MEQQARIITETCFGALERRDRAALVASFADDAVIFDPHYPKPEMRGRAEIEAGLDWGLSVMQTFGFRIVRHYGTQDGLSGAFEVDTNHVLKGGQKLSFMQAFFVDTRDGLITGMRAYEPYGPNGIGGFFLGLERLKRRITGRS